MAKQFFVKETEDPFKVNLVGIPEQGEEPRVLACALLDSNRKNVDIGFGDDDTRAWLGGFSIGKKDSHVAAIEGIKAAKLSDDGKFMALTLLSIASLKCAIPQASNPVLIAPHLDAAREYAKAAEFIRKHTQAKIAGS
jgi:hypothetical protein